MKNLVLSLASILVILQSGCVHYCTNCRNPAVSDITPFVGKPTTIHAVGYGSLSQFPQYTAGQQKLMAMRAAKIDAYRALVEQVYGFRISGSTTVSAFATQNDNAQSYVDAFIRGAKVVSIVAIADGNFEATVELELPTNFYSCLVNRDNIRGCTAPTLSLPGAHPSYEISCDGLYCQNHGRISYVPGYYDY